MTVASVESDLTVKCSRDVKIVADQLIGQAAQKDYDLVVLPVSGSSMHMHSQCDSTNQRTERQRAI